MVMYGEYMICELCGKETKKLIKVRVEGSEMDVCEDCAKFGTIVKSYSRLPKGNMSNRVISKRTPNKKITKPKRDIFDNIRDLVEDYGDVIKEARLKKGLSLEELSKRVGIKLSTLHKIERMELEPEEKYVKRLEKELNINLYEEGSDSYSYNNNREDFTLGDFVKIKRR